MKRVLSECGRPGPHRMFSICWGASRPRRTRHCCHLFGLRGRNSRQQDEPGSPRPGSPAAQRCWGGFHSLDVSATDSFLSDAGRYQERVIRRVREGFVLHPRQLVIASTLEYIQLPPTLMAYVIGKSTWGRTVLSLRRLQRLTLAFAVV